ncbi:O-antigen ligase family protein [Candidatus Roizmanbacteria bacterium]|nr:MAG: O-antigen ligase family protein [Candidatus Roizmanbacteria bacterium]
MLNKFQTSDFMNRTIRFLYYLLFLLTPLLMSARTTEMFEFNKIIFIYTISILASTVWIIHYILHRPKLYLPKLLYVLLFFLGTQLLSSFFSIDTHTSLFGYYGRWNGGLLSIASYTALFFVFIQSFGRKDVANLLQTSLMASVVVILWGLPAKFGGDLSCLVFTGEFTNACWTAQFQPALRMFSTLGQPNWLGAYLAVHFFIGLYFLFDTIIENKDPIYTLKGIKERLMRLVHLVFREKRVNWLSYLYGGYLVLNLLAILFTRSRSSLLAVALSMLIGGILLITDQAQSKLRFLYRSILITAVLVTSYFIVSITSSSLPTDTPEHLQVTDSFQIRQVVWKGALELGLRYPLFGTGPETFAYSYYFTRPLEHNLTSEWDFIYNKAHNEFLNYFATTGFIGFAGYLAFIGYAIYTISREKAELRSVSFLMAYITILITNFFGFSTSTQQLFLYLLPAAILAAGTQKDEMKSAGRLAKLQAVAAFGVGLFLLWNTWHYYQADRLYKLAQEAEGENDYQTASQYYIRAIDKKYEHVYEDKLSTALAQLAFLTSFGGDASSAPDLIALSRDSNTSALQHSPDNLQYWRTKAKNNYIYYQMTGDINDLKRSVDSMRYTTVIAPTDAQSYYMLGLFYSLLDQEVETDEYHQKAVESVEYAIKLRPNFIEAQELLGQIKSE